jgi:hypothetical protein
MGSLTDDEADAGNSSKPAKAPGNLTLKHGAAECQIKSTACALR